MLTIAALTAIAALTSGAGASADTLAPGGLSNAPLGSLIQNEPAKIAGLNTAPLGSLIQNEPAKIAGLNAAPLGSLILNEPAKVAGLNAPIQAGQTNQAAPTRCRAWRVSGQTWYASQGSFSLLFTLKMASSPSPRFGGYARYNRGDPDIGGVPSQAIRGAVGSDGSIHMDIVWTNGTSGQYNGTAYDVQRTSSGGLTARLHGTTVDTTGNGAPGARWDADGMPEGFGQTNYVRPLYCPAGAVVR
jgi:hypothetical protein